MKKSYSLIVINLLIIVCFFKTSNSIGQEKNGINDLHLAIKNAKKYDKIKLAEIDSIRTLLRNTDAKDLSKRYILNEQMFHQFKFFKRDSAFYYGMQAEKIAYELKDRSLLSNANINLADICVSSGMYKEALDFLEPSKIKDSDSNYGSLYFGVLGRCYGDMAEYSNTPYFQKKYLVLAKRYREKAFSLTEKGYFFNEFLKAFNKSKDGRVEESIQDFKLLLKKNYKLHDQALIHYMLGDLYQQTGYADLAISHLSTAVISDIETSTKESLAIIKLAELLFKKGDLKNASILIKKANQDASFYGAQQRKIQIGAILPYIEQEVLQIVEKEKQRIYWQYITVSFFLIIAIGFGVIIFYQYGKLKKAKKIIVESHRIVKKTNSELLSVNEKIKSRNIEIKTVNKQLLEANKIKEEYLGLFFTQYDAIFEKFNSSIVTIKKYFDEENFEKVKRSLANHNLKREKEKLLENFDTAFINLFPNFIKEFNSLMKDDHKVTIEKGQFLTKELRIYALIKLGITQNEIIAQILGYSVNSIYAYKTKIRNNSTLNKDDFDQKLLKKTTLKL